MNENKWKIAMWISTAAAVIAGAYFTKSAWCLWTMIIPILAN